MTQHLSSIVEAHRAHIGVLAQSWLGSGAIAFGVRERCSWIALWPETSPPDLPAIDAPIKVNGQHVGDLCVYGVDAAAQKRLTVDAQLLSHIASMESELSNMTRELIESQDQVVAMYDMLASMRSRLNLEEALLSLARESCRLLGAAAACAFVNFDPLITAQHPAPVFPESALKTYFEQLQTDGSRLTWTVDPTQGDLPCGATDALVESICVHHQVIAALCLVKVNAPFTAPDLKLARAFCDHAASQIENVLLYQEKLSQARLQTEMELAKNVQIQLLPQHLPSVAGLDIAAATLPALQVGGDFYDFLPQPGEPFVFTVGDVTGKGISAAMLMAMIRAVMRSKVNALDNPTPVQILGSVNDEMYDDFTQIGMFATVFVGQYDPHERIIYYANAGHSPVIHCPSGGEAYLLRADGPPVGVLPMCASENHAMEFNPGDVLVVCTDGFSEARNKHDELFGHERMLALIESVADQPAQSIVTALYAAVAAFGSDHMRDDDQTIVVLKGV
jgi:sigma-B regulation protein RsbU (phosphoserine phosphatase)